MSFHVFSVCVYVSVRQRVCLSAELTDLAELAQLVELMELAELPTSWKHNEKNATPEISFLLTMFDTSSCFPNSGTPESKRDVKDRVFVFSWRRNSCSSGSIRQVVCN